MVKINLKKAIKALFIYETPKLVEIENWKIGLTQRVLQVIIAIYVVCWVLIYEKGYQVNDDGMTSVTTKVKGIMILKYPSEDNEMPQVADAADIVYPPLENNAFFIMTNRIVEGERGSACSSDNDCVKLTSSASEIGVRTGKCLSLPSRTGVCEIYAWCPLENDTHVPKNGQKTLDFIRNYTVYIKNDIEFPKFKVKRNNRDSWVSNASIGSCRYDPNHPIDKYCPIFKMSTIFDQTGVDTNTIFKGGVLGIIINWECDLDHGIKNCNPQYSFTNLEDTREKSSGFNFRYAIYYREGGVLYRDLIKAFGIRFSIFVHATAGKFNIIPLFLNLGSGLALLGLAPTVCDIIILNLVGTRRLYKRAKFEVVKTTHASEKEVSEKCTNLQEDHQWNTSVQSKKYDERLNQMPYIEQE
ncbi:Receptor for ATP that acts as a ligand-gated ion channel [Sparganum proliferum]